MISFEEACKLDSRIQSCYEEAQNPRPRNDPKFCRRRAWHAIPKKNGMIGLRWLLSQVWPTSIEALDDPALQDLIMRKVQNTLPPCAHGPEVWCENDFPEDGFGERKKRETRGLVDMLREAGGGPVAEPVNLTPINDENEPIFLVNSLSQFQLLHDALRIEQRLEAREISAWYAKNWCLYFDEADREKLLATKKENLTGALLWKPIVMTFNDQALLRHLKEICDVAVTVIETLPASLEAFREEKLVLPAITLHTDDDEAMLDGKLGQIYRRHLSAFPIGLAWPALVTAASVLVAGKNLNLFCALVAPAGCGKSQVIERACTLLGVKHPVLLALKAGSAEGLTEKIGNVGGAPRLLYPDELAHLFAKMNIENSSFATVLNTAFYNTKQESTITKGKQIEFNCALSLAGGVVTDMFDECFGKSSTGGLYDRFIFGTVPDGYKYSWRELEGADVLERPSLDTSSYDPEGQLDSEPPAQPLFGPVRIHPTVHAEADRWAKEYPNAGRAKELAIRVATICAAIDGREELHAEDLDPAEAFFKYQVRMRAMLSANPGKNTEGILQHKFTAYLRLHAPDGRWVSVAEMYDNTNARDLGLSKADAALRSLEINSRVEISYVQHRTRKQRVVRLVIEVTSW